MKNNFVAIDFETSYGHIPCSIGIMEFIDGEVVNEYYSLIKPIDLKFNPFNSGINGIYLEDVFNEREFDEIWPEIEHFFIDRVIVAHNISTDINVLEKTLHYYRLHKPNYNVYCTLEISRNLLDLNNHKLSTLAKHFCIIQNNYHNALEDAFVCGKIFLELFDSFQDNYNKPKNRNLKIKNKIVIPTKSSIAPYIANTSEIFLGKKLVVSGVFCNFSREEIIEAIKNNGGIVNTSISTKTDFVLAGDNMGPAKLEKATQLGVKIISENDFIQLVNG